MPQRLALSDVYGDGENASEGGTDASKMAWRWRVMKSIYLLEYSSDLVSTPRAIVFT